MRGRIVRLGLGASLALVATAPMTAPADAWACIGTAGQALCFVVGTSCRAVRLGDRPRRALHVRMSAVTKIRFVLAGAALAAAAAPLAPASADPVECRPGYELVCVPVVLACDLTGDHPKLRCD